MNLFRNTLYTLAPFSTLAASSYISISTFVFTSKHPFFYYMQYSTAIWCSFCIQFDYTKVLSDMKSGDSALIFNVIHWRATEGYKAAVILIIHSFSNNTRFSNGTIIGRISVDQWTWCALVSLAYHNCA